MESLDLKSIEFSYLKERVKKLEDVVYKKSKKQQTTRAQQMLLLKHLGLLEIIADLKITKKAKSQLLSTLLNVSAENIEDDLTTISSNKSPLVTKKNYEFLKDTFETVGLTELNSEIETILDSLHKKG